MTHFKITNNTGLLNLLSVTLLFLTACSYEKPVEKQFFFPNESWQRYNILKFDLPVTESGRSYDVCFVLRCRKSISYDKLPLNMVLNSPSGEERIREYEIPIRNLNGSYTGTLSGDTCINLFVLKKNLYFSKNGVLKVEIENLNPKMETEGVFSAGLILIQR